MKLDREQLRKTVVEIQTNAQAALGEEGTLRLLEKGLDWDLSGTLRAGGVLVFPHMKIDYSGHQIAACAQACLDSGSDRVIVISVLHPFTDEMEVARNRVAEGGDVTQEELRGIQGTGIAGRDEWRGDHALLNWRFIWEAEIRRRGLKAHQIPEVIERYPHLTGGKPETLPGIEALQEIAKDAVIVTTADGFHHGIGYGVPPEEAFYPDEEGLARARAVMEEGMALLEQGNYWGYNQHCLGSRSDARDTGPVYHYLRGPLKGKLLDLVYRDSRDLYNKPPPTWVAGALIEWVPVG